MIKFKYCAPSITYTYSNTDADNLVFVALKNNATRSDDGPVLYARGQKMEFVNSVWKTWVNTVASDMEEIEETVAEALTDFDTRLTSAETSISGKQATLVSGTNIKTVNNTSLLGSGNISISGGDTNVIETVKVNGTALTPDANKAVDIKGIITRTDVTSTSVTQTLTPNVFYSFGTMTSLTVTLGSVVSGVNNVYSFEFTSGSTATTLTLPNTIVWQDTVTIEANTHYEISIKYAPQVSAYYGMISSWDVS